MKSITQQNYKKVRRYTGGGVGKAKTRGAIVLCLDFFGSFCIKAKRTMHKPRVDRKTKKAERSV